MTFSVDEEQFGKVVTFDLIPNGRNVAVTNENKKQYIEYVPLTFPLRHFRG